MRPLLHICVPNINMRPSCPSALCTRMSTLPVDGSPTMSRRAISHCGRCR